MIGCCTVVVFDLFSVSGNVVNSSVGRCRISDSDVTNVAKMVKNSCINIAFYEISRKVCKR